MMQITVARDVLVKELQLARGIVDAKSTIPVLSNVLLEAEDQGGQAVLRITTTDLDSFFRTSIPVVSCQRPGRLTVPAARLFDYVRALPSCDVALEEQENFWVKVWSGRSRARIAGMSPESFPVMPECPDKESAVVLPLEQLSLLLGQVSYVISKEQSRFTLDGALLQFEKERLRVVATDGHRLAVVETTVAGEGKWRVLVPRKAVRQVERIAHSGGEAEADVEFFRADNRLHFRMPGREYVSRELSGQFPEYARVLPKKTSHAVDVNRVELAEMLQRVAQFSDEQSHCVRLSIANGELKLEASVAESGESEESVAVAGAAPPLATGYNAEYLMDFLRAGESERVRFFWEDATAGAELRPVVGGEAPDSYRYVVMPMRV